MTIFEKLSQERALQAQILDQLASGKMKTLNTSGVDSTLKSIEDVRCQIAQLDEALGGAQASSRSSP